MLILVTAAPVPDPLQYHQLATTDNAERQARVIIFRPLFVYRQQELQHLHYLQEHKQQLQSMDAQKQSPLGLTAVNFV